MNYFTLRAIATGLAFAVGYNGMVLRMEALSMEKSVFSAVAFALFCSIAVYALMTRLINRTKSRERKITMLPDSVIIVALRNSANAMTKKEYLEPDPDFLALRTSSLYGHRYDASHLAHALGLWLETDISEEVVINAATLNEIFNHIKKNGVLK